MKITYVGQGHGWRITTSKGFHYYNYDTKESALQAAIKMGLK